MASTIIGTYPILNNKISFVDENGIQTITYIFTVKSSDVTTYLPKKDDPYYGPDVSGAKDSYIKIPSDTVSQYLVTQVNIDNLNGGLTKISVTTAGTQNTLTKPRLSLIPNQPLIFGLASSPIFGLASSPNSSSGDQGAGTARGGVGIVVTFIGVVGEEQLIFERYSYKSMPSSILGMPMPIPARQPFIVRNRNINIPVYDSVYSGYLCTETSFQRIGGVTLYRLSFKEQGYYQVYSCKTSGNTTICTAVPIYSFKD
jgi:hypothetical protein